MSKIKELILDFFENFNTFWFKKFNLIEFDHNRVLVGLLWANAFNLLLHADYWLSRGAGAIESIRQPRNFCPDYFQNCENWIFLHRGIDQITHAVYFSFLLAVLFVLAYSIVKKKWSIVHLVLCFFLFNQIYFSFLSGTQIATAFEYFSLVSLIVLIISRQRLQDLKYVWVFLYFLAGIVKINESWIVGSYFSSLRMGLYLFPDWLIPFLTNLVIISELFGIWFLLSAQNKYRVYVYWYFMIFHIYSAIYVNWFYPLLAIPTLTLLFFEECEFKKSSNDQLNLSKRIMVLVLILGSLNLLPLILSENNKVDNVGGSLAMNMFDSNRQTHSTLKVFYKDKTIQPKSSEAWASNAFLRVWPNHILYRIKKRCVSEAVDKIQWTLETSMNGGPFRQIVNVDNACDLSFSFWGHNDWIDVNGPIVGYPRKNFYLPPSHSIDQEKGQLLYSTEQITLSDMQKWILEHLEVFKLFYGTLATIMFILTFHTPFRRRLNLKL